jgi:hypothetical protein
MLTGKIMGAGGAGGVPDNVHLYSNYSVVTNATFSSVPFGEENASRYLVIGYASGNSNTAAPTSVTIGGVSASLLVQSPTAAAFRTQLWIAAVPTGTSGTLSITNSSATWNNISVAALYLSSGTAVDTGMGYNSTTLDASANVTGPKGVAVGYCFYYNGYTSTPSGFTLQDRLTSNVYNSDFLLADGLATETPRTLQCSLTGNNNQQRLVSATFTGA